MGVPSYLVDDGGDIEPSWVEGIQTIGITAGASAPESLVESVIAAIAAIRPISLTQLEGATENIEFGLPSPLRNCRAVAE